MYYKDIMKKLIWLVIWHIRICSGGVIYAQQNIEIKNSKTSNMYGTKFKTWHMKKDLKDWVCRQ